MVPSVPSSARFTNSFCGYREIEYLPEFYCLHRQRRPDVSGRQRVAQGMRAVVGPDTPIVIGVALGVLAVFVVKEGDNLVHYGPGHRKTGTENRPRKLQGEVCADTLVSDEIFEASANVRGRVGVKLDAFVDALFDHIMHGGVEL